MYFLALGNFAAILSSVFSSMSQRATISPCLPASLVSLSPLPPTPMQAKRTFSLGDGAERPGVGRRAAEQERAGAGHCGLLEEITTIHARDSLECGR